MERIHKTFFLSSLTAIRHQVDALESMILALNNDPQPVRQATTQNLSPSVYASEELDARLGEEFDRVMKEVETVEVRSVK